MLNESLGLNNDVRMMSQLIQKEIDNNTPTGVYKINVPTNKFNIREVVVEIEKNSDRYGAFSPYETIKDSDGKWSVRVLFDHGNIQRSTIAHELNHAIQYISRGAKYDKKHIFSFTDYQINLISRILKIKDKDFFKELSYKLYKLSNQEIEAQISGGVYQMLETGVMGFTLKSDVILCKMCLDYDIFKDMSDHNMNSDIVYKFIRSFYKHIESYEPVKSFRSLLNKFVEFILHDMTIKSGKKIPDEDITSELLKCQKYLRNQSRKYLKKIKKIMSLSKGRIISNKEQALQYFKDIELNDEKLVNSVLDEWEKVGYPKSRIL